MPEGSIPCEAIRAPLADGETERGGRHAPVFWVCLFVLEWRRFGERGREGPLKRGTWLAAELAASAVNATPASCMLSHACTRRIPRGLSESSWISHPFLQPVACESRMREERGERRPAARGKRTSLGSQLLDPTVSHRLHMQTQKRRKEDSKPKPQKKNSRPLRGCSARLLSALRSALLGFGGKLAGGELHLSDRGKVDLPRRSRAEQTRSGAAGDEHPHPSQSPCLAEERQSPGKPRG